MNNGENLKQKKIVITSDFSVKSDHSRKRSFGVSRNQLFLKNRVVKRGESMHDQSNDSFRYLTQLNTSNMNSNFDVRKDSSSYVK